MKFHPLQGIWNTQAGDVSQPDLSGVVTRVHTVDGRAARAAAHRKVASPRREPLDDFVGALGHGIKLLECWSGSEVWLTNADLAARSGLTKPTVSRLASVLVDLGYLAREGQRGRLRLTAATLGLGFGSPFAAEPVAGVHAELARLASELDVYAAFSIRRADKVQVLDNVASPLHPDAVPMDVGGLLPICRSASGLAALSALRDEEALPLVDRLRSHYGSRWQALQRQLARTKEEYSSKGYCSSVAGLSRDVAAVAVPVVPVDSDDVFVIACGMAATDFHRERVEKEIVPQMLHVARALGASLGA
jgi:DNA-binding IclR family transcriptional regulator